MEKRLLQIWHLSKKDSDMLNAVGAIGAVLSDMNIHHGIVKTFAVAARAVGLVAHIAEDQELGRKNSIGQRIYDYVEENTDYRPYEQSKV
jgi:citrate synthase